MGYAQARRATLYRSRFSMTPAVSVPARAWKVRICSDRIARSAPETGNSTAGDLSPDCVCTRQSPAKSSSDSALSQRGRLRSDNGVCHLADACQNSRRVVRAPDGLADAHAGGPRHHAFLGPADNRFRLAALRRALCQQSTAVTP